MNYSTLLLRRFFSTNYDNVAQLMLDVTDRVFEIEGYSDIKIPHDVVIGYVTSVAKHPNADKLTICQVDCGSKGVYQICTGASNIRADIFVPVSIPGCYLPAIDLKIEPRKMRGEDSNGMICSVEELGFAASLGADHGIWILNEDFDDCSKDDLGKPLAEKYPWLEHFLFDVKGIAIANRGDLLGHWGAALEFKTLLRNSIYTTSIQPIIESIKNTNIEQTITSAKQSPIKTIVQTENCRSYIGVHYSGIMVKPSDFYTKLTLTSLQHTPRNNRVDRSNLFMELRGQPVHCFDKDLISGNIVIRMANDGEQFDDLMGASHTLTQNDIVICDDLGVIALAGVIGGIRTAITDKTTSTYIEIANFDPVLVRKTAQRLGLRTDAAVKFEKNINPTRSSYLFLQLIDDIKYNQPTLGTPVFEGISVGKFASTAHPALSFSYDHLEQYIFGTKAGSDFALTAEQILLGLGFEIKDSKVYPPIWRSPEEQSHRQDLSEEISRHIGLESIPNQEFKEFVTATHYNDRTSKIRKYEDLLVQSHQYSQCETYGWYNKSITTSLGIDTSSNFTLINSLNPEDSILRDHIFPCLLDTMLKNYRQIPSIKIFDHGFISLSNGKQRYKLSFGQLSDKNTTILDIKNQLQQMIGNYECTASAYSYFHPTLQCDIKQNNEIIGYLGLIHPVIAEKLGFPQGKYITVCEIDIDLISVVKKDVEYRTLSDQIVSRDISCELDRSQTSDQITMYFSHPKLLSREQVDLYPSTDTTKSITYRLEFLGTGTTSTEEFNSYLNEIIGNITKSGVVKMR